MKEQTTKISHFNFPEFSERFPWIGPDLQSLRASIFPPKKKLMRFKSQMITLPIDDGSGDSLTGTLHIPYDYSNVMPLIVLIHGLGGSEDSPYVLTSAVNHLKNGFAVLRLNLRGAGSSGEYCKGLNHPGRVDDLCAIFKKFQEHKDTDFKPQRIVLVGFSLGANLVLRFLNKYEDKFELLTSAVAVSSPLDLALTSKKLNKKRSFHFQKFILKKLKKESSRENAEISEKEKTLIKNCVSIWEIDEKFTAGYCGFNNVKEYYESYSIHELPKNIKVKTLVIYSKDDPFVPFKKYKEIDLDKNNFIFPLLTKKGGHCGFHWAGKPLTWHDKCISIFLDHELF